MPKEARILPDMLLTVFKKEYFWYFIALCYVIIALLSTFCLHCHTTKQRRVKRGTSMSCGSLCLDCDSEGNGCLRCKDGTFLITVQGSRQALTKCVIDCPNFHYHYWSRIEPDTCKRCQVPHCRSCDSTPSLCHECDSGFLKYQDASNKVYCLRKCPKGFKKYRRKKCIPRKQKCTVSSWVQTRPRACICHEGRWQIKLRTRKITKGDGTKCKKKLERWKFCRAPRKSSCNSSNSFPTKPGGHQPKERRNGQNNSRRKSPLRLNYGHNSNNFKVNRRSSSARNKRNIPIPRTIT